MDDPMYPTCVAGPNESTKSVCRLSSPVFNIFPDLRTWPLAGVFSRRITAYSSSLRLAFEPPYDRLCWLGDRRWWGDNCSDESRVRNTQWLFYGWHNLEFFDMPFRLQPNYYICVQPQHFYRDVLRSLCMPTPAVVAYHGSLDLQKSRSPPRVAFSNRCRRVGRIVLHGLP